MKPSSLRCTHGLISNIGKAHLEGLGSYEGLIIAKTEMYGHVKGHKGTLFVNGDDELLMTNSAGVTRITYGRDPEFDTFGEQALYQSSVRSLTVKAREATTCLSLSRNRPT